MMWTRTDDRILLHLYACPQGDDVSGTSKAARCTHRTAVTRLERMVMDRLVVQQTKSNDRAGRRLYVYQLTENGKLRARLCSPIE